MVISIRRGWWKPWNWSTRTWLLAIAVMVLVAPLVTRWVCLWQVPDIELPFKVEDVIREEVPRDEDAMVGYATALRLLDQSQQVWISQNNSFQSLTELYDAEDQALQTPDRKWDDRLDSWLISRRKALEEYQQASEMERAGGPSLKSANSDTPVNVHQDVRRLARLAELDAARLERAGEIDAAYGFHLTNLRCARHCQSPRFVICHLIGIGVRSCAYRGIARWAEQPSLTIEHLQNARRELVTDFELMVPASELIKADYLLFQNSMGQAEAPNYLFPRWGLSRPEEPQILFGKRLLLWVVAEPEVQLRLARQLLVNNLDEIDLPLHMRHKTIDLKSELVFVRAPNAPSVSGQISPERLYSLVESQLAKMPDLAGFLIGGAVMDRASRSDTARRKTLDIVLACHQYQRLHGEFPETIEQLVPSFLDSVPFDPMDKTGASLRYRRELSGEAMIWSIGYNAVDDDGDISNRESKDVGYRIRLN